MNPYPINKDVILDCGGEIIEDLEESLDDDEKMKKILDDQGSLCKKHSAQELVNIDDFAEEERSSIHNVNIALEGSIEKDNEETTVRMQEKDVSGDIMELKVESLSGNLEDFCGGAAFSISQFVYSPGRLYWKWSREDKWQES